MKQKMRPRQQERWHERRACERWLQERARSAGFRASFRNRSVLYVEPYDKIHLYRQACAARALQGRQPRLYVACEVWRSAGVGWGGLLRQGGGDQPGVAGQLGG